MCVQPRARSRPLSSSPAIEAIAAARGRPASFLLHGVTGSGKTEVYLRAIADVVARGEQALVLVPEIALTPQLVARFAARFDAPLAVLHSSLNDQERLRAWRAARSGTAPVVIGTRSAVFAPLARAGLIVVDEEHDPSYKQQEGFRYSARDLALARAQRLSIPVVLGSATPSLESLERARAGKSMLLALPNRTAGASQPRLHIVDLRRHAATQGIATPTVLAIKRHLDAGGQVLLYLNRRGYAPSLFCPSCGWVAPCPRCDARLTVHQRERRLHCHHCGTEQRAPETCPTCGEAVKPVGQGTERIEETLAQLFPDTPLARIDRDAVRRRGALEAALDRVTSGEVRLLVGTQMLTKGHHFPDVSLVVVLNADQGLFGTDFRASERLAQTIVQVAGRAGRAERPGEVLIQTEYPEHPLLAQLVDGGYDAFASAALDERRLARWPPFARIAVLRAEAARREAPTRIPGAGARVRRVHGRRPKSRSWGPRPRRWSGAPDTIARSSCCMPPRTRRCSDCSRAGCRRSRNCRTRARCAGRSTWTRSNSSERPGPAHRAPRREAAPRALADARRARGPREAQGAGGKLTTVVWPAVTVTGTPVSGVNVTTSSVAGAGGEAASSASTSGASASQV